MRHGWSACRTSAPRRRCSNARWGSARSTSTQPGAPSTTSLSAASRVRTGSCARFADRRDRCPRQPRVPMQIGDSAAALSAPLPVIGEVEARSPRADPRRPRAPRPLGAHRAAGTGPGGPGVPDRPRSDLRDAIAPGPHELSLSGGSDRSRACWSPCAYSSTHARTRLLHNLATRRTGGRGRSAP